MERGSWEGGLQADMLLGSQFCLLWLALREVSAGTVVMVVLVVLVKHSRQY